MLDTDNPIEKYLCFTEDWVFCHIPKNGGTTFRHAFLDTHNYTQYKTPPPFPEVALYHQTPSWWEKNDPRIQEKQWICITRNPYARYVSWFFFIQSRQKSSNYKYNDWRKNTFGEFVRNNFLENIVQVHPQYTSSDTWRTWNVNDSQTHWYNDVLNMRYFSLENDLLKMEEYTKIPFSSTIRNKTEHKPYQEYYTQEIGDIVYDQFRSDFETFGYEKETFK